MLDKKFVGLFVTMQTYGLGDLIPSLQGHYKEFIMFGTFLSTISSQLLMMIKSSDTYGTIYLYLSSELAYYSRGSLDIFTRNF